ncbi:MAG: sulfite exporter TauE/SafE family protein, partial [Streptosporangiaceae bacterium]
MTEAMIGFGIALAVGLTGIGGGSFTVPALVLIAGLGAGEAVGTAFLFAGALRLIAAPFYLVKEQVDARYLRLLLQGAVPGLLAGIWILRWLSRTAASPMVLILLGALLVLSSAITFVPQARNPGFAKNNPRWLPWLALPIGVDSGFSSAGAGALGSALLLNFSELTPAQVVGTDLLFALVLATLGSAFYWSVGSIRSAVLFRLLLGGVPGVLLGCAGSRKIPAVKLKAAVALVAMLAGAQLVWSGVQGARARTALAGPASPNRPAAMSNQLPSSVSIRCVHA